LDNIISLETIVHFHSGGRMMENNGIVEAEVGKGECGAELNLDG
jgi:hypothetical protein